MKPSRHIMITIPLSLALWLSFKSLSAAVICFISGVFIDIDHLIEYLVNFGWKGFSLQRCYRECGHNTVHNGSFKFKKLHLIFHSLEFAVILWLLAFYAKNIYIFAFTLGYSAHLAADILGNRHFVQPYFYFLSWRASRNFLTVRLMHKEVARKNSHLASK